MTWRENGGTVQSKQTELVPAADTSSAFVDTDLGGYVVAVDEAAARLLGVNGRWLLTRDLLLFFPADRRRLARELDLAGRGFAIPPVPVTLYPKERRRSRVVVRLQATESMVTWSISMASAVGAHGQSNEDSNHCQAV